MAKLPKTAFPIALFAFQVLLLGLFGGYVNYKESKSQANSTVNNSSDAEEHMPNSKIYPHFQDVHVMIFVGFGFLMTFLRKYGFGAVSYNLLIAAVTIQWATLLNPWIRQRVQKEEGHESAPDNVGDIFISIESLMTADFTAAAVLITYGAILGKATRLQLLVIAIIECIFFAVNETIIMEFLYISDVGGSIVVHLFGAYFGLAVSAVLGKSKEHDDEASNYHSDLFSMIGTLFLWVYWPSFNAGLLGNTVNHQDRAIINTYFALASSTVATFFVSVLVNKKFKLNMVHIQNATLAGGVAVGTSADLMIEPWGAMLVGILAGSLSTIGYTYVTPFLSKKCRIHDTCGVHNLHGMPGILAGTIGAIAAASIDKDDYPGDDYKSIYSKHDRSLSKQGGYQFSAMCVSFAFAVVGGIITGFIVKMIDEVDENSLYNDDEEFELPEPDGIYNLNENQIEMKRTTAQA